MTSDEIDAALDHLLSCFRSFYGRLSLGINEPYVDNLRDLERAADAAWYILSAFFGPYRGFTKEFLKTDLATGPNTVATLRTWKESVKWPSNLQDRDHLWSSDTSEGCQAKIQEIISSPWGPFIKVVRYVRA